MGAGFRNNEFAWGKFNREYPRLREELVSDLLEPAARRVKDELERVTPLETARLLEAARKEAIDCGLDPAEARPGEKSGILQQLERLAAGLTNCLEAMKKSQVPHSWFLQVMQVTEPLVEHYRESEVSESPYPKLAQQAD